MTSLLKGSNQPPGQGIAFQRLSVTITVPIAEYRFLYRPSQDPILSVVFFRASPGAGKTRCGETQPNR